MSEPTPAAPRSEAEIHLAETTPPNRRELDELRKVIRRNRKELRRQLRHQRQFLTILATILALFTAGIGIFFGVVHSTDRSDIQHYLDGEKIAREKFDSDLKTQFMGKPDESRLGLYYKTDAGDLVPLDGQKILVTFNRKEATGKTPLAWNAAFYYVIRNESDVPSGEIYEKLYSMLPFHESLPSSDEPKYIYETNVGNIFQILSSLPGRYSTTVEFDLSIQPEYKNNLAKSATPILLKFFYGRGKISTAVIYLSGQ